MLWTLDTNIYSNLLVFENTMEPTNLYEKYQFLLPHSSQWRSLGDVFDLYLHITMCKHVKTHIMFWTHQEVFETSWTKRISTEIIALFKIVKTFWRHFQGISLKTNTKGNFALAVRLLDVFKDILKIYYVD